MVIINGLLLVLISYENVIKKLEYTFVLFIIIYSPFDCKVCSIEVWFKFNLNLFNLYDTYVLEEHVVLINLSIRNKNSTDISFLFCFIFVSGSLYDNEK